MTNEQLIKRLKEKIAEAEKRIANEKSEFIAQEMRRYEVLEPQRVIARLEKEIRER